VALLPESPDQAKCVLKIFFGKLTPASFLALQPRRWQKGARHKPHYLTVGFFHTVYILCNTQDTNNSSVVELSDDCKKVRCSICEALRGNSGWIQKESLPYHLKSDVHARSVRAQQNRDSIRIVGEQSIQEESAIEETMDFAMLSSAIEPPVTMKPCVFRPSVEEQEMWDNSAFANEIFNAGIDHTAAAAEERKRLEQEATNFDLWRGADFLPEEDPNDGELLLNELEQEDILTELLRNTRMYTSRFPSFISIYLVFSDRREYSRRGRHT